MGSVPELVPADIPFHELGTPTACWTYRDETGGVLGAVARFDPPGDKKECLPLKFVHDSFATHWEWAGFWTDRRPLYGLERLARNTSAPVLLVEGEKTADAGQKLFSGYVVMTWAAQARSTLSTWPPWKVVKSLSGQITILKGSRLQISSATAYCLNWKFSQLGLSRFLIP